MIKFDVGREKDFFDFVSKINDEDKIALVSHNDPDGLISAKVFEQIFELDFLNFVNYKEIDLSLVKEIKKSRATKIIFTDLSISDINVIKEIEKFAEVLIIDHHVIGENFNSSKTIFLNASGYCATYISYYLISKIKNIENIDWLVACACISDFAYKKNQKWMEVVFEKYGEKFSASSLKDSKLLEITKQLGNVIIYFRQDLKKVYNLIGEDIDSIDKLKKYSNFVKKEIDEHLNNFEKERKVFGNVYFWKINPKFPISSIISNATSIKEKDKVFVIIRLDGEYYNISARRQDGKVDLPKFLKKVLDGFEDSNAGGHIPASGGYFLKKDLKRFEKRLEEESLNI
jgi:single-stranded DNA-specific DHH superfamily exonuclease